jgi:hypothetical protein
MASISVLSFMDILLVFIIVKCIRINWLVIKRIMICTLIRRKRLKRRFKRIRR